MSYSLYDTIFINTNNLITSTFRDDIVVLENTKETGTTDKDCRLVIRSNEDGESDIHLENLNGSTRSGWRIMNYTQGEYLSIGYRVGYTTSVSDYNFGWNEYLTIKIDGNIGIGTSNPESILQIGTRGKTSDTDVKIIAGDSYTASLSLYGNSQGTGKLYVGQSLLYGGGIMYEGDNTPTPIGSTDTVSFYTRTNGIDSVSFYMERDTNDVIFNGNAIVNGVLLLEAGTHVYSNADSANLTNTYIAFGEAGSSSDYAFLRQIGGTNEIHLALDFHDDGNETGFSIRDVDSFGNNPDIINTRFMVKRDGKVGIGTDNPLGILHIEGNSVPSLYLTGNTQDIAIDDGEAFNVGHWNGSDTFTERLRINSNGNVGIGVANPSTTLEVKDRITISSVAHSVLSLKADTNNLVEEQTGRIEFVQDGGALNSYIAGGNNELVIANVVKESSLGGMRFMVNNTETTLTSYDDNTLAESQNYLTTAIYIKSDGNVGIGTDNPSRLLHVYDDSDTGTTTYPYVAIFERYVGDMPDSTNPAQGGMILLKTSDTNNNVSSAIGWAADNRDSAENDSSLSFWTMEDNVITQRMSIDKVGVGIGTDNPLRTLHVAGQTYFSSGGLLIHDGELSSRPSLSTGATQESYEIRAFSYSSTADNGFLRLRAGGGASTTNATYIDLAGYSSPDDMNQNIVFGTSGTERVRIDSNGNVGIGTDGPLYDLDVNGRVKVENGLVFSSLYNSAISTTTPVNNVIKNSASLTSGKWYRIAVNGSVPLTQTGSGATDGTRCSARFTVMDTYSGHHSTRTFYAGGTYGNNPFINLLSNTTYYNNGSISKVRIIEDATYEGLAIEIYVDNTLTIGTARVAIDDNYQANGFTLVDFAEAPNVYDNYIESELNFDNIVWGNFYDLGTDKTICMDISGRVGIGTSTPSGPLHIYQSGVEDSDAGTPDLSSYNNTAIVIETASYGTWAIANDNNENLAFFWNQNRDGYILNNNPDSDEMNFTGQHRTFIKDIPYIEANNLEGLIVCANNNNYIKMSRGIEKGNKAITINESLPIVSMSTNQNDKSCFGVISRSEDPNTRIETFGKFVSVMDKENGDTRIYINSVGEGAIWIVNSNGNIESGDYITTSSIKGYGMKQDDDILHNYTVAKITMDCDFNPQLIKKQQILKDTDGNNILNEYGEIQWEDTNEFEFEYNIRYVDTEGTIITKEKYEYNISNNILSYIAAFVGCTYHCG